MKVQNKPRIKITKADLKAIMAEYEPSPKDDDYTLLLKQSLKTLEDSDRIIFTLYIEFASEQKVANILNVSRTPVHSLIVRCRTQINEYLKQNSK